MPYLRTLITTTCCVALLWGCARAPEVEESADLTEQITDVLPDQPTDPAIVRAAPEWASTVFANEWVEVARVNLAPYELIPPYDGGARYVYPLSSATVSVIHNDENELVHLVPGEFTALPTGRISLSNVNDTTADFLIFERTPIETSPELDTIAIPDVTIDMESHGTVLLDDNNVTAVEIALDPLASDPLPPDLPTLIYALSDCDLVTEGETVPDVEQSLKNGEVEWQPAGYNAVTNTGDTAARILVIGFKN